MEVAPVAGKKRNSTSPIVTAIEEAERETSGEIRVHLSKRWIERDAFDRALKIFRRYQMSQTADHNAVLIYVNLRKKKFAIIGDSGIHQAVGQASWEKLSKELQENLRATQSEKAIALVTKSVGQLLKAHFPVD